MNLKHLDRHPKSHRTHAASPAANRNQIAKRRSSRMFLNASVVLLGEDRQKCSFSMPARATGLNKHGAALQLSRDLVVGCSVQLRNKQGIQVPARVVSILNASQGVSTYGIEFLEHDEKTLGFWGISFPVNS
jgi:PilZ domain-containing protein